MITVIGKTTTFFHHGKKGDVAARVPCFITKKLQRVRARCQMHCRFLPDGQTTLENRSLAGQDLFVGSGSIAKEVGQHDAVLYNENVSGKTHKVAFIAEPWCGY